MSGTDVESRLGRVEVLVRETEAHLERWRADTALVAVEPMDRLVQAVRELTAVVRDLASQGGQATPSGAEPASRTDPPDAPRQRT